VRKEGRAVVALLAVAALGTSMAAAKPAREPRIDVPAAKLRASLHCQKAVKRAKRTPVLLVTGTGVNGSEAWPDGLQLSLTKAKRPSCYVDFPENTTGDIQVAAEYLVYAIRATERKAGRKIAVFGVSQGGLLPRWALTYWPSTRALVTDVVAVAGTQHGTTVFGGLLTTCQATGCAFTAAAWQQASGSKLVEAIARYPDESPGKLGWTTVRSLTDEIVTPTDGPNPTSALRGASNIVIQGVCPGRMVSHIQTGVDSVSYAVLIDAIRHRGPARAKRLPKGVCRHPFAPGLDDVAARAGIQHLYDLATPRTLQGTDGGHTLPAEPPVRAYALR
jgi:hypothetical protein